MKQVLQHQKTGVISVEELPNPQLKPGGILVQNAFSLISAGTERTSVSTAQASLLGKARSRPDLVRQVLDAARRDGVLATLEKVQTRLDCYKELGYSSSGIVIATSCDDFRIGDRVACAGGGYASHAGVVFIPKNLACLVPDNVALEAAAYTTVAAIAMQGVRQADVRVGERVVVMGLGLIGLLTVQILKASGCAVIGLDVHDRNFALAAKLGCDACALSDLDSLARVEAFTRGVGSDAVIITAATKSSDPVELAMQYARKRSKVVVVGAVGMQIPRSPFYEKEVDLRISCSYGPGRYDAEYEERGLDYPIAYARWTERRNMEAVLDLMSAGKLDVDSLTTHTFAVENALDAYELITGKTQAPYLGVLLGYPQNSVTTQSHRHVFSSTKPRPADPVIGFIGAGNFAQSFLLPPLRKSGAQLEIVATSKPVNAHSVAKKHGFRSFTTDANEVLQDPAVQLVCIGTRHDSHAHYVCDALRAGKHVFVEKPLALNEEELEAVTQSHADSQKNGSHAFVMVGFNRRFSAPIQEIKAFFEKAGEPLAMLYRVNAGYLPHTHWSQDREQGGRILGELCHFVDTLQYLSGAMPTSVYAQAPADRAGRYNHDNVSVTIDFADGSVGTILYLANGAPALGKEYLEVHSAGRSAVLDNFKTLEFHSGRKTTKKKFSGDKGHAAEMQALLQALKSGTSPIPFESLHATTRATFAVIESLRSCQRVDIQ